MTGPDDARSSDVGLNDGWAWLSMRSSRGDDGQTDDVSQALAKSFTRTFGHDDGARVLAHLRSLTKERTLGPEAPDGTLRYVEGQRGLVAYMERLIARGRA